MAPPPTKNQKLASLPTMDTINDRSDSIDDINKEGEDDDSSSVSSGISCEDEDEVNDENDIVAHTINNDGKSAYELLREEKIARNNARLKELGLLTMKQPRKPHKRVFKPKPVLPARRSTRLDEVVTTTTPSTTKNDGTMDLAGLSGTSGISCEDEDEVNDENENDNVGQTINNDGKSAYELLREEKIARNNARLKELGFLTPKQPRTPQKRVFKPKPVLPAREDQGGWTKLSLQPHQLLKMMVRWTWQVLSLLLQLNRKERT